MCKCKAKCNCNITEITKGEKGDTGATGPQGPAGTLAYKVYVALLSQTGGDNPESFTNGSLSIGRTYEITNYQSGDDFTNVGAPLNANGVKFVATGDTPLVWSNSSELSWNYGAPTVTVLENTLSGAPVWAYDSPGYYTAILAGEFTVGKTVVFTGTVNDSSNGDIVNDFNDVNEIWIRSRELVGGVFVNADDIITNTGIEIRVYN